MNGIIMKINNFLTVFETRLLLSLCILVGIVTTLQAAEDEHMLFDFDQTDAEKWQSINDNVMGGLSEGSSHIMKDGLLEFSGKLSLENRGGFASVRSRPGQFDLSPFKEIVLRVRGDGRTYYCNLHVPTIRIAYSYRAAFATKPDKWQEIRIPLKQFRATWFGRTMKNAAPIDPKKVRSMGFTIADKKAGPFKLEIDWIKGD